MGRRRELPGQPPLGIPPRWWSPPMSGRPRALAPSPAAGRMARVPTDGDCTRAALAARIPTRTAPRLRRLHRGTSSRLAYQDPQERKKQQIAHPPDCLQRRGAPPYAARRPRNMRSAPRQAGGAGHVYIYADRPNRMSQGGGGERTLPPRAAREASWTFCKWDTVS